MTTVGVIGYGSAGARHAALFAGRGCTVLLTDPAPARAEAATGDGYRVVAADELYELSDAVVIASPNHLHAAQLAAAVDAGCDVLVEKPIAVEPSSDVEQALAHAVDLDLVVGVGCNLRFVAAIETCRELVGAGVLGSVVRVRAEFGWDLRRWRPGRELSDSYSARRDQGGGILLDAIHEFDYLYWIFGSVAAVTCIAGSRTALGLDVEDVACVVVDFRSGVLGEIALDYASGVYRRGFEVVGDHAELSWRWPEPCVLIRDEDGLRELPVEGPEPMYERLTDDFLAAVAERRSPRTSGADGLAVLRIVAAARESAATRRHVELAE